VITDARRQGKSYFPRSAFWPTVRELMAISPSRTYAIGSELPTIRQMASFQLRSSSSLFSSFWRSAITSFPYFMVWHPRLTSEQAHVWFREQLRASAPTS